MRLSFLRGTVRVALMLVFALSAAMANTTFWFANIANPASAQDPATNSAPTLDMSDLYLTGWISTAEIPAFTSTGTPGFIRVLTKVTLSFNWASAGTIVIDGTADPFFNHDYSNVYMSGLFTVTGPDASFVQTTAATSPLSGTTAVPGGGGFYDLCPTSTNCITASGASGSTVITDPGLLAFYEGGPLDTRTFNVVADDIRDALGTADRAFGTDDGRTGLGTKKGKLVFNGYQNIGGTLQVQYEYDLVSISGIPEPATTVLVGGGLLMAGIVLRRRRAVR